MSSNIEAIEENVIDLQLQEMSLALAKRKLKWNASREYLGPVTNSLVKIGVEPRICDNGDYNLYVTGDKQKLLAIFRILMASGFHPDKGDRPQPGQSSWCAWFENPKCKMKVWFSFTSSVCVRVKTGTKMVEVDVFETKCGDITELPACEIDPILVTESTPALSEIPF